MGIIMYDSSLPRRLLGSVDNAAITFSKRVQRQIFVLVPHSSSCKSTNNIDYSLLSLPDNEPLGKDLLLWLILDVLQAAGHKPV